MLEVLDVVACTPVPVKPDKFNQDAEIPFGLTVEAIASAIGDFTSFLGFVNNQLRSQQMPRLESILMPANFSSIVGEFMKMNIPKYCTGLVSNNYHNGHPDLIPAGVFPSNSVQHAEQGIELKGSRYDKGWQGHNAENCWLMVFVFDSGRPTDVAKGVEPIPFRIKAVYGAQLEESDWNFSGRSATSRRTITASVTKSGYTKMTENWIYQDD